MAGLAHDPAHFFKFLFILVLYTLAMTLFVRINTALVTPPFSICSTRTSFLAPYSTMAV